MILVIEVTYLPNYNIFGMLIIYKIIYLLRRQILFTELLYAFLVFYCKKNHITNNLVPILCTHKFTCKYNLLL